jgi:hypothetical protein
MRSNVFGEEIGQVAKNHASISQNPTTDRETHLILVLHTPPSTATSGDTVTFTGTLSNGEGGISGKTVLIKDNDPYGIDNTLGAALTGNDGQFVIEWTAKTTDPRDNTVEVYAMFKDFPQYATAKSLQYVITIIEAV